MWVRVVGAAIAALGFLAAFIRWVVPRIRRFAHDLKATRDAILGRDAVKDSITGKEIAPYLPSMGQRLATVEGTQKKNARQIKSIAGHLTMLEATVRELAHNDKDRVLARQEHIALLDTIRAVNTDDDTVTKP